MKRVIAIALAVVAVAVAIVAIAPLFVSTEIAKKRIAEEIAGWTGRAVTLNGEPEVSLFPSLTVTLRGITIANPAGMTGPPFISMDAVVGRVKLLPLFIGRTEIAEFSLIKPRINLRISADGRQNWTEMRPLLPLPPRAQAPAPTKVSADKTPVAPTPVPTVTLGRFVMRDGIVTFENEGTGEHDALNAVNIDFAWPSIAAAASGSGSFVWRGETVEFNASVNQPLTLMGGGASSLRLALASTPARFSFEGTGAHIENLQLAGDMTLTTPSLRRLMEWFGTPMGPGAILGPASLSGKVNWTRPDLSIAGANVALDGNSADGALSARFVDNRASLQGTFAADRVDLTPYVDAFRARLAAPDKSELYITDKADLDLRLSAGEIIAGPARIGSAALAATLTGGEFAVTLGEAHLYGGQGEAELTAKVDDDGLNATAQARLDGVSAAGPLGDYLGIGALSGTGALKVDLSVRGRTWAEVAHALAGTAKVTITDGSLAGLDIRKLAAIATDPAAMKERSGSMPFSEIGCTVRLADRALTTSDLHAEGDGYAIRADGKASLIDASLDGKGSLTVVEADTPTRPTAVPFLVKGKWYEPVLLPDFSRIPAPGPMRWRPTANGPGSPGG